MKKRDKESGKIDADQSLLFKCCVDNAPLAIFRHDASGRFLYANPKALSSLGYSFAELLNLSVFDIDPVLTVQNWPGIWQSMCDLSSITLESIHIRKDGTTFPVEVIANLLEYDGEKFAVSFVQDITERKTTEESLRLTQFAFEKAAMGIFRIGSDAQILKVNEHACTTLGFTADELCSMTIFDIDPTMSDLLWTDMWQVLNEQKTILVETEHRKKDGSIFPVEITANLLEYGDERQSIAFVRDITKRKENEQQRQQMQNHLRQVQKMEALGTLAGGIAHDFNNILSAVLGYTELTQLVCADNPKAQQYLSQLGTGGMRAKKLVKQILSFSRQGKSEKHFIDLSKPIKEAVNLIKVVLPASIELSVDIPANLGIVLADETQIHQIVMNLCTNAYQAMEQRGGKLDVHLAKLQLAERDTANFAELPQGQYLNMAVTDTGIGMAPDILPKIFDPYFTTKKIGEGSGMGLSTVHGIVKDHGGIIKVYSEKNIGTTFQVFFPIVEFHPDNPVEVLQNLPGGDECILFVDDEILLIELGKELLEGLGYRVETRASSIDALEAFRAQPIKYDLVVSDMTMPRISGQQLAREIRKIRHDIPIILCTGFSTRLNEKGLADIGVTRVLMKPVTLSDLATNVRAALDHKSSTSGREGNRAEDDFR